MEFIDVKTAQALTMHGFYQRPKKSISRQHRDLPCMDVYEEPRNPCQGNTRIDQKNPSLRLYVDELNGFFWFILCMDIINDQNNPYL